MTTGAVCASCNNGWMSDLEGRAKPMLETMLEGRGRALHQEGQRTLAAWALKTAIMVDTSTAPSDLSYPSTTNWRGSTTASSTSSCDSPATAPADCSLPPASARAGHPALAYRRRGRRQRRGGPALAIAQAREPGSAVRTSAFIVRSLRVVRALRRRVAGSRPSARRALSPRYGGPDLAQLPEVQARVAHSLGATPRARGGRRRHQRFARTGCRDAARRAPCRPR